MLENYPFQPIHADEKLSQPKPELEAILLQSMPENINNGNELLLKELGSKKIYNDVRNFIYSRGMRFSDTEIEDIVQDTLLKAVRAIQDGKFNLASTAKSGKEASLQTWLFQIAINTARDLLRRNKIRAIIDPLPNKDNFASNEPTSEQQLITAERNRKLKIYLNDLPPLQRQVIELSNQGLSLKEIAKMQGEKSIDTIKSRKRYAIAALKKWLKEN